MNQQMLLDIAPVGMTLSTNDGWLRLTSSRHPSEGDGSLDAPALWKQAGIGSGAHLAFEVPLQKTLDRIDTLEFDDDPLDALVAVVTSWAEQTLDGAVPEGWSPPPRERLDELVPAAALSFRTGLLIEAARIVADDSTLRVQVSLGRLDPVAPGSRRKWIDRLIAATADLHMVRVGFRPAKDQGGTIEAAIDLSGAPAPLAEALLPIAVDALRHCFTFFGPTATLIGDAGCSSLVLDTSPSRNTGTKRSHTK